MRYAVFLADAARIASAVYRKVNTDQQVKGLYRKITGEVNALTERGSNNCRCNRFARGKVCKDSSGTESKKSEKPVNKVISFAEAVLERVLLLPQQRRRHHLFLAVYLHPRLHSISLYRSIQPLYSI